MPERRIHAQCAHSAEKARDTLLDDGEYEVGYSEGCPIGKSMIGGTQDQGVVTALCNQPEAFALDIGDDQSRYWLLMPWLHVK